MIERFIDDNEIDVDNSKEGFKEVVTLERTIKKDEFFLAVLKKWNSTSPKYPLNRLSEYRNYFKYDYTCGGGYFLVIGGYGLVIDPGYKFLETFYENGFVPRDIDGIYVSHAHEDHCIDFEPIFSVLHKAKKWLEKSGKPGIKIDLFINSSTFQKFKKMLEIDRDMINRNELIDNINPQNIKDKMNNDIRLRFLNTKHNEEPWHEEGNGKGLKVEYNNKIILYSSDTEYYDSFAMEDEDKFDVLILNIGTLGKKEHSSTKNHLGLIGIKKILDHFLKQKLFTSKPILIISEMGFELEKKRIALIETLREYVNSIKKNILLQIIYSEPGIIIDLNHENIISRMAIELHEIEKFIEVKEEIIYCIKNLFSEPPFKEEEIFNHIRDKDLEIVNPNNLEYEDENIVFIPKSPFFFHKNSVKKILKIIYTKQDKINHIDALKYGLDNKTKFLDIIKNLEIPDDQYLTLIEYENLKITQLMGELDE